MKKHIIWRHWENELTGNYLKFPPPKADIDELKRWRSLADNHKTKGYEKQKQDKK